MTAKARRQWPDGILSRRQLFSVPKHDRCAVTLLWRALHARFQETSMRTNAAQPAQLQNGNILGEASRFATTYFGIK